MGDCAWLALPHDSLHLLLRMHAQVANNLDGGFPVVLDNLWLGEEESNAIATALQPKLTKTRSAVEAILHDVATLEVRLPPCLTTS